MTASETLLLSDIAHGRSGDKGNHANVAVIAYTAQGFDWIRQHLTADVVARYFQPWDHRAWSATKRRICWR